MRMLVVLVVSSLVNPLFAASDLAFKKDMIATVHWFPYGLVLVLLVGILLFLAKKSPHLKRINTNSKVIETIAVNHKTKVYVIELQGKQFLIADNQNALAISRLDHGS